MKILPEILSIKSDKKELVKVEQFLRLYYKANNLPEDTFNKVWLCVSEAVINSIEHGNKMKFEKKVTIKVSCVNTDLEVEISDEGDGFNYTNVADPTSHENILKETGRGIFIMKAICSNLKFRDKGKCVEIKIELM